MNFLRKFFSFVSIALVFYCLSAGSASAVAVDNITIPENRSELIELPKTFTNVNISNKSIVRVIKHSNSKISIIGKKQGTALVDLTRPNGRGVYRAKVKVTYDVPAVKMAIRRFFPAEAVDIQLVNDALVLSGAVTDAEIAHRVTQITKQFAGGEKEPVNVINLLQIRTGQQVMLRVRIGEVQRGTLDVGPQGILGDVDKFDNLVNDGMIRLLAEPSLVAISGESAEFLSGGELPIPVRGSDGVVEYKPYGVSVKFTPFVLSQNRIRLIVEPEVSELSNIGSVQADGISVPGITSRRAKTTVELAPGESFMIAGLIKNDLRGSVKSVEKTDDGISALFKGNNITNKETELVIAVTPHLVDPVVSSNIKLPTDIDYIASKLDENFESILSGLGSGSKKSKTSAEGLKGSFGPMVE
jgi:pilus assembly protein CpaC